MKKTLSLTFLIVMGLIMWLSHEPEGITRSNGAQLTSNYTGAPGFANCTQCHSGVVNSGPGMIDITTNIPNNLYTPGQTYQISVTLNSGGGNQAKYGFMLAPMTGTTYKGTLQATDGNCVVEPGGRWITHTSTGNSGGVGSKIFSFNWTAPAAGAGTVILYAAGNCANGNGGDSGDQIYTTSLTLNENMSVSTHVPAPLLVSVSPNPAREEIRLKAPGSSLREVRVYDLEGRCRIQTGLSSASSVSLDVSHLTPGNYVLFATDLEGRCVAERIVKY
jgi:hypothetical protein